MKITDREALREWSELVKNIANATPIDNKSQAEILKHRNYLEAHPLEWITYFFSLYANCDFAPFHKKAIKRLIENDEWYEVLSWSRELAKSTIVMFAIMYLTLTGRKKNVILTSSSADNAIRLLKPYRANLEANARIIAYYGEQKNIGDWAEDEFITKKGVAFRAVGAGQPPRGSRNNEIRPDIFAVDDFDTDSDVRNPDIVKERWEWWERALYPSRSISKPTLVVFSGNIIAKDCCITRAGAKSKHWDIVNIRDENGRSTWPEKNSEESIDTALCGISTSSAQAEYFNNPVSEGAVFKEIKYGRIPPLSKFRYLVAYSDPAPGQNKTKKSSSKAVWLVGRIEETYYVVKGFLDRGLNSEFIDWHFLLNEYVKGKTSLYFYMENNSLQDPFFEQVFKPLFVAKRNQTGIMININPDSERKTDKATRIEARLEPLNRDVKLIFNIEEREDPHMKRLDDQFRLFTLQLKFPADGPDCIEGAIRVIDNKHTELAPPVVIKQKVFSQRNKHRL